MTSAATAAGRLHVVGAAFEPPRELPRMITIDWLERLADVLIAQSGRGDPEICVHHLLSLAEAIEEAAALSSHEQELRAIAGRLRARVPTHG